MPDIHKLNVFGKFLPEDVQLEVLHILQEPYWQLGNAPMVEGGTPPSKLWHMNGLERYEIFSKTIYRKICEAFDIEFEVRRIYANGQVAGQKGDIHRDDGDVTFLYFPLQKWRMDWGGSLMFYKATQVTACVSYVPNRAVSFPANTQHGAEAPSLDFPGLRVSVAWKLLVP